MESPYLFIIMNAIPNIYSDSHSYVHVYESIDFYAAESAPETNSVLILYAYAKCLIIGL